MARVTARVRSFTPSFSKTWMRWVFTVASPMCSVRAISGFDRPSATRRSTSSSRGESAGGAGAEASARTRRTSFAAMDGASTVSPAATERIPARISSCGAALSRYPLAPASIAARMWSSVSYVVRTSTRVRPPSARMRAVAAAPSSTGIRRSISTRSGCSSAASATASAPSTASPTTSMPGSDSSRATIPERTMGWSSATTTRMGSAAS